MCFWQRWLAQLASCPVNRVSGASTVSWPPPAMKVKHTQQLFQPLLVHSDLSHVLFLILHFNPLHLIFITAFAQLSALWCSQFMLVQQMIEDVCQSPFTSLLLLVYPLLYTQAFRCHPVVSCLSSFFSPCCWPHSIKHA